MTDNKSISNTRSGLGIPSVLFLLMFSGTAVLGQITVSPTTLFFRAPQYASNGPESAVVTNVGGNPVSLGSISFAGADAGDFSAASDSCSLHTIAPSKKCKISITFYASAVGGTTETATLSINDSSGNSLQSVALNGVVATGPATATLSGLTVTINNRSMTAYSMDFTITGPYSDTGTGTCTDLVSQKSTCTIVLKQNSQGQGEISIHMAPLGSGGHSYRFNIPLS